MASALAHTLHSTIDGSKQTLHFGLMETKERQGHVLCTTMVLEQAMETDETKCRHRNGRGNEDGKSSVSSGSDPPLASMGGREKSIASTHPKYSPSVTTFSPAPPPRQGSSTLAREALQTRRRCPFSHRRPKATDSGNGRSGVHTNQLLTNSFCRLNCAAPAPLLGTVTTANAEANVGGSGGERWLELMRSRGANGELMRS